MPYEVTIVIEPIIRFQFIIVSYWPLNISLRYFAHYISPLPNYALSPSSVYSVKDEIGIFLYAMCIVCGAVVSNAHYMIKVRVQHSI